MVVVNTQDASPRTTRLIIDNPETFSERFLSEPVAVRHSLADDDRLSLEALAELADQLPAESVERHRADLPVLMPGGAPDVEGPPSETVRTIETNGCWMVMWYMEQHPVYRDLLNEVLDEVAPYVGAKQGGMQRREAFLFLSAPNAVTPVHFDPEHNFLLQIKGAKDMNVCEWDSRASELEEFNRYHDGGHRNLATMPRTCTPYRLNPGGGVYVPPWRPHWVQNTDAVSISLSITFRTAESERSERVHVVNSKLRRMHLSPRPPGEVRWIDRTKEQVYLLQRRVRPARPAHKG
jgi:hypothetical protein